MLHLYDDLAESDKRSGGASLNAIPAKPVMWGGRGNWGRSLGVGLEDIPVARTSEILTHLRDSEFPVDNPLHRRADLPSATSLLKLYSEQAAELSSALEEELGNLEKHVPNAVDNL